MCGLAGMIGGGESLPAALTKMADAIAHRGPDDSGSFVEDGIGLAHRRLAIVDLSAAGHQPIHDASRRYVMAYNGEIYNHRELRENHLKAHAFVGTSDSETLIELFAAKGPACFELLNGIFACAIVDTVRRTVTLARDGVGVKPLYVWNGGEGRFAFASELKALVAIPGFSASLDRTAAAAYITYLWSPGERTMFEQVRKFPAGCWQTFDSSARRVAQGQFYTLPDADPSAMSDEHAISGTYAALKQAVDRQMLSDVEVGCFLSGGLDSSAIVHLASRHSAHRQMNCFTLAYDTHRTGANADGMSADLPYARLAAKHLGVALHEVRIASEDIRDMPELVDILDEPQGDLAAMANLFIARAANARGIKVLLGGAGGDDVFSGYRRHLQFANDYVVGAIPAPLRALAHGTVRRFGTSGKMRRLDKLLGGMQGDPDQRLRRAFEWLDLERACTLLADPPAPVDVEAPMTRTLQQYRDHPPLERLLRLEQAFFLRDHNLNYTDKTGMDAGVEIRVPFLDRDLMAFAARLPLNTKLRGKTSKWVLRKAMEPHLPHNVIYRPKTGFGVPLREWMAGPLREQVYDYTSEGTIKARGLYDPAAVARLRNDHYAGRVDAAYPLLVLMMTELWCRRFA